MLEREEELRNLLNDGREESFLQVLEGTEGAFRHIMLSFYKHCQNDFEKSLDHARQGYELAIEEGDERVILRSMTRFSECLHRLGRYSEAHDLLESRIGFVESLTADDPYIHQWTSHFYYQLGINHNLYTKEYERSLPYFMRSADMRKDNPTLLAHSYNGIAITLERLGRLEEALEYYNHSLSLKEKGTVAYALTLANIGALNSNLGNLDLALENYLIAKEIYERHEHYQGLISVEELMGFVAKERGDLSSASIHYNNANNMAKDLGLDVEEVNTLKKLIPLNIALGRKELAENQFEELKALVEKNGFDQFHYDMKFLEAIILRDKPRVSQKLKALELFKDVAKANRNYEVIFGTMLSIIDLLIIEYKKYADNEDRKYVLEEIIESLETFEAEVKRLNSPSFNISLMRVKAVIHHLQGETDRALELLENAISEARGMGLELKTTRISQIIEDINQDLIPDIHPEIGSIRNEYRALILSNEISEKDASDFYELLNDKYIR